MTNLYLTTCFHGNLMYSSIPENKRKEVIDKCYKPILSIPEELNIKIGIEFPAISLEIINKLEPKLIEKIKMLWKENKIEFVGSGYTQSIFPLIPAEVNLKNLKIGNQIYKKLLGRTPETAFVNEQVYSSGLVELYLHANYKTIIIDWPNAAKYNKSLETCKYTTTKIKGTNNQIINVLWNNSIAFQKLQRYVYGDMDLKEYLNYINSNFSKKENRIFMVYGNDMEIFDFRPRDPKTLHSGEIKTREIKKLKEAFKKMNENYEFVFPSKCLKLRFLNKTFKVGTTEYPIITKKQDKYNVTRWAVCGKQNSESNTLCYKCYYLLKAIEVSKRKIETEKYWKDLVELWGGDYRTYTESKKWNNFRKRLKNLLQSLEQHNIKPKKDIILPPFLGEEKEGIKNKLQFKIDEKNCIIETDYILLQLHKKKGGTIKKLIFKRITNKPMIKLLEHDYYKDISFSADFFSGHTIIHDKDNRKITDIGQSKISYLKQIKKNKIRAICQIDTPVGQVIKTYYVYLNQPRVDIKYEFKLQAITPTFFRVCILTINPECFDIKKLIYKTTNGGFDTETFKFHKKKIEQDAPVDIGISSRHCLGSSEGWLAIGDNEKELVIITDKSLQYSTPLLHFEKIKNTYFLRILNSICETDETSKGNLRMPINMFFSLVGISKHN